MNMSPASFWHPSCISVAWLTEAFLIRVECWRSLVQERYSTRKCFTNKTTLFHYKVTIFTNCTPL